MPAKDTSSKKTTPAKTTPNGNGNGAAVLENSPRMFEVERNDFKIPLDIHIQKKLDAYAQYLAETKRRGKPHMSGILEAIIDYVFDQHTDFQSWLEKNPIPTDGDNSAFEEVNKLGVVGGHGKGTGSSTTS